jgi:hypothetical protein
LRASVVVTDANQETDMRNSSIRSLSVLAAAATLALTGGVNADAAPQVPFKGEFTGTMAFISQTSVAFSGTVQATYFGRGSTAGLATVLGATPEGCILNAHSETITAANGDQLMFQATDLACPIGPTTLHGTGHWVVTGGTGRFAGASGGGELEGESDFGPGFSPGTYQYTLTGSLSY